ncbi:MAG: hypothetical protein JW384_02235 [Nitrosomonadaceae bacterium]|nr:hypothetical protein [Nitrosomonadaceae bacterium]
MIKIAVLETEPLLRLAIIIFHRGVKNTHDYPAFFTRQTPSVEVLDTAASSQAIPSESRACGIDRA